MVATTIVKRKLLRHTRKGIYCIPGKFYLDPWRPVDYAVISHGHADHAHWGMGHYLCHHYTKPIIQHRIGADISVESVGYNEPITINGVKLSLHPAGHLIGSAQIRLEYKGEVAVFTGDYKVDPDDISTPFESVRCHTLITESTFGLPIYRWQPNAVLKQQLSDWVVRNQAAGKTSVFIGYSLGKAQRIMKLIEGVDQIFVHNAIDKINHAISTADYPLPETTPIDWQDRAAMQGRIVIVPPALIGSTMIKKIPNGVTAFCSGWMQVRGKRRWRAVDAGFPVSDHADWEGLLTAVKSSEAERVLVTHGAQAVFAKYLNEIGINAAELRTEYGDQEEVAAQQAEAAHFPDDQDTAGKSAKPARRAGRSLLADDTVDTVSDTHSSPGDTQPAGENPDSRTVLDTAMTETGKTITSRKRQSRPRGKS